MVEKIRKNDKEFGLYLKKENQFSTKMSWIKKKYSATLKGPFPAISVKVF